MSGIDIVKKNISKILDDPDFKNKFEKTLDKSDSVNVENVWYASDKEYDDFENRDDSDYAKWKKLGGLPTEGPEWDEALEIYIESLSNQFLNLFGRKTVADTEGIYVARCIGVDDAGDFIAALKKGDYLKGYKGLGIYWSWDQDLADCHWQKGQHFITVQAWVDPNNIDYTATALANLNPSTGVDEAEITLKEGAEVWVVEVKDHNERMIFEGEQIMQASVKPQMNRTLVAALQQVIASDYSSYNSWRMLTDKEIEQEYEWEYPKVEPVFGDIFPTVEDFKRAVKKGKTVKMSEAQDRQIAYRSRTESVEELKDLVKSYRFPRDVDRIIDGFETNSKIPYPIVLNDNGRLRIMSGNTRMDTAYILGVTPKVLIVDINNNLVEALKKLSASTEDVFFLCYSV